VGPIIPITLVRCQQIVNCKLLSKLKIERNKQLQKRGSVHTIKDTIRMFIWYPDYEPLP
jgi:hypothetical protein